MFCVLEQLLYLFLWGYLLRRHCKVVHICMMVSHAADFVVWVFWLDMVSFSMFVFLLGAPVETYLDVVFLLGVHVGTPMGVILR